MSKQFKNKKNKQDRRRRNNKNSKFGIDRAQYLVNAYGKIIQNQMNFLPPFIECPMRYGDSFTLNILAGGVADYVYRANSVFDPDRTSAGHQCRGFDSLSPLYNRYRVDHLSFYVSLPSVTLTYKACVGVVNGSQTFTTMSDIMELPMMRAQTIGFNGAPPGIFTGKKSLWIFNGRSMQSYHVDDITSSLVTGNPSEVIDFHIFIENPNLLTAISVQVEVSLKYRTVFFDPITPVQSFSEKQPIPIERVESFRK